MNKLKLPDGHSKLLLHSCCAPCSGDIMLRLKESDIDYTIYFYNPNIHPKREYLLRKEENLEFAKKHNIPFIDDDYDTHNWFDLTKGQEWEPERGKRCTTCFDMRFYKTAQYADSNNFRLISSTLGISRWKNMNQINESGVRATSSFKNIDYWTFNWRKNKGSENMINVSKNEEFYMQEYCGCVYSLRDTNIWRNKNNRPDVEIGIKFYSKLNKDTSNRK
ncbi:MAG: epoxyqueuosine reductase QueH [Gammaproteobacteria bacterium]|nr:epoxyqueuosine reductase QueH [Gammaproteobacteria bacterium]MBL6818833.1 epoxyqueuosine reductase QueH [Gammaproteobacteria bacterium]MBL6898607.1 epoxyqueuosine reductase QueH [Gammaproteobacteria bacterium]